MKTTKSPKSKLISKRSLRVTDIRKSPVQRSLLRRENFELEIRSPCRLKSDLALPKLSSFNNRKGLSRYKVMFSEYNQLTKSSYSVKKISVKEQINEEAATTSFADNMNMDGYYLFGSNDSWESNLGRITIYNISKKTKKIFDFKVGKEQVLKKAIEFLKYSITNTRKLNSYEYIIEINNCDKFLFELIKLRWMYNESESTEIRGLLKKLEEIEVDFFLSLNSHGTLFNINLINVVDFSSNQPHLQDSKISENPYVSKITSYLEPSLIQLYFLKHVVIVRNNESQVISFDLVSKLIHKESKFYSSILKNDLNKESLTTKEEECEDSKELQLSNTSCSLSNNEIKFVSDSDIENLSNSTPHSEKKKVKIKNVIEVVSVVELYKRLLMYSILSIKIVARQISAEMNDLEGIYLKLDEIQGKKRASYDRIFKLEETIISLVNEIKNKYLMLNGLLNKNNYQTVFTTFDIDHTNQKKTKLSRKNQQDNNQTRAAVEHLISYLLEVDIELNSHMTSIFSLKRNLKILLDDINKVEDARSNQTMTLTLMITSLTLPIKLFAGLFGMNIKNPLQYLESEIPFYIALLLFFCIMIFQFKALKNFMTIK